MTATGTEPTRGGSPTKQRTGSSRDMAGRKREYETIYILRPDITNDVIAPVNRRSAASSRRAAARC